VIDGSHGKRLELVNILDEILGSWMKVLEGVEEPKTIDSGAATEVMGRFEIGLVGGGGGVGPPSGALGRELARTSLSMFVRLISGALKPL
jgi:hypothetical protein